VVIFAKSLFIYYGEKMMDKENTKENKEAM
jgi:hypothetical protein